MTQVWRWAAVLGIGLAFAGCAQLSATSPSSYKPHPFDEQLAGQWYYECRYFMVDESLPLSVKGYAIYFDGRTRERMDISVGTDCSEDGRIMTMRFEGSYRLGRSTSVKLGDTQLDAIQDEEVKDRTSYELTPTFASVVGDDASCKSLVGRTQFDGSVPALATCQVTKDFRDLETRTQHERTVLFVDRCRLLNGDDEAPKDADGYPTSIDTKVWGLKPCPDKEQQ